MSKVKSIDRDFGNLVDKIRAIKEPLQVTSKKYRAVADLENDLIQVYLSHYDLVAQI